MALSRVTATGAGIMTECSAVVDLVLQATGKTAEPGRSAIARLKPRPRPPGACTITPVVGADEHQAARGELVQPSPWHKAR